MNSPFLGLFLRTGHPKSPQVEDLTEDLVATQEELSSQQMAQQKDQQQHQARARTRRFSGWSLTYVGLDLKMLG